jgi:predicted nucleic acid-binding protein
VIVVDTSIISYLIISGDHTLQARAVFRKDPEWVAPLLWRSEFRNVLALYLRKEYLTLEDAIGLMDAGDQVMKGGEFEVRSNDVLKLASTSHCSAYDCEFVALAKDLGVPLVTTDQKLLNAFPPIAKSPEEFIKVSA